MPRYQYKYLTGFYRILLRIYEVLFTPYGARLTRSALGPPLIGPPSVRNIHPTPCHSQL
jgi:hypothetical protein